MTAKLASVSKRHKLSVKKSIVANFTIEKHKAKMRNLEKDVLELKQSKTAVASKLERAKEMLSDFGKLKDDMAMHKTINAQLKADLKSSSEKLVEVLKNRNDQIRKFKESHEGSIQALKDKVAEMETESKEMREEMEVTKASESLTKHSLGESHERAVRLHSEILQETENNRTLSKALRDLKKEKAKLVEKTVAQDVELAEMKTLRKTLEVVRESLHQTTMSHEQLVRSSAQLRTEKDRLEEKHVITHRNEQQLTIECGRLKRIVEEHETECPVIEIDYNKIKQDHLVCTQRKAHFEEQEKAWKVIERENERQLTKLSADLERWVEIARINKEKVRMYEEL